MFINELPPLTTFKESDTFLVESNYTVAGTMSGLRDWVFSSAVIPSLSVTNFNATSATFTVVDVVNYELSGFTITGSISSTDTIYANYLQLSSVEFTGETTSSVTSVTATDKYVKVIVNNEIKYLRLYDVE